MIWRILLAAGAALALFSCDFLAPEKHQERAPSPLLYEVKNGKGELRGWLFGTIHSLPQGTKWQTKKLDYAIARAGMLVVEVADLDRTGRRAFDQLAYTPGLGALAQRVAGRDRTRLKKLIKRAGYSAGDFKNTETWAAALILAQVDDDGKNRFGADRVLADKFKLRRIFELEGAAKQLAIFDHLSVQDQADLLNGVVDEVAERRRDPQKLRRAWLSGDIKQLEKATHEGLLADKELREALLVGRNRAWIDQIYPLMIAGERPLVAVGSAHLVGTDGLAAMLRARGLRVTRVQ